MTRWHLFGFALSAAFTAHVLVAPRPALDPVAHHGLPSGLSAVSGSDTPTQASEAPSSPLQAPLTHANGLDTAP
jgi:alcohol dehydrogenase class IV